MPSDAPRKLNYGEWGELYVMLRLLGEGRLDLADENERPVEGYYMEVTEVIRPETADRKVVYRRPATESDDDLVDILVNGRQVISICSSEFQEKASELLEHVQKKHTRAFSAPEDVDEFLDKVEVQHTKASSADKSDIYLSVVDPRSGLERKEVGYSIKTKWSQKSTLFNTAKASAAIFYVGGMNDELAEEVNSIEDAKGHADVTGRVEFMLSKGCSIEFSSYPVAARAGVKAFEENLDLIDPRLPKVIAWIMESHFKNRMFSGSTDSSTMEEIGEALIRLNPLDLARPEVKYPYMLKSFLYAAYCGMTASTLWDGRSQVNGGLITVGLDGRVLAFNALESDVFKSYLYRHCIIDYPSTDPGHGNYGRVYREGDDYFFRFNFQVRFGSY